VIKKFNHKKGSSLIIAVLLIGVVSVVSFGVSSLTMNDMKLHRLFVGSGESYYGAESTMEEALLEVKNDRNYSTTGPVNSAINGGDLTANHIATYYGDYFYIEKIKKDDFVDVLLGVDYATGDELCIARFDTNDPIIQITENGGGGVLNRTNIYPVSNPAQYAIINNGPVSIRINFIGPEVNNLYIKSTDDNCSNIDISTLEKLKNSIIGLNKKYDIDTGSLTIKATGTYKNLNRQLQATIDRKSGTLLNIFDFTLYSIGDID